MKALITGASSGIGRKIAEELDERGYDLVLVARNKEKLKEVKDNLNTKNIIFSRIYLSNDTLNKKYKM